MSIKLLAFLYFVCNKTTTFSNVSLLLTNAPNSVNEPGLSQTIKIMKKNQYNAPLTEILQLDSETMMKELGPASLPQQVGGAPARRVGEMPCDTI